MGIYNYTISKCKIKELIPLWECTEFNEIYLTKAKSVYSNLNVRCYVGNIELLDKVKRGEIKPELVALLPPFHVFPERWNHIIQENERREKLIYESTMAKTTDKFVCPNSKCRGRKCVYVEAQIRSADEPMTTFITCLLCGKRFQQ
jgi:transcription elongation factor S-II